MADPLGVSTGQGRGFAQEFGDTYNPYFKEETVKKEAKVAKADKTISDALGTISTKELWNRDVPLLNEKKKVVNNFVRENYRNILNGDIQTLQDFQDQVDDISNLVYNSKETKKEVYQAGADMLKNPENYTDEARKSFTDFVETPGRSDIENINFEKKFQDFPFQKQLADLVGQLERVDEGYELDYIDQTTGKEIYKKTEKTKDELVRDLTNQLHSSVTGIKQIYATPEDLYKQAKKYITNKTDNQIKTPNPDPNAGYGPDDLDFNVEVGITPFGIQQDLGTSSGTFKIETEAASTTRTNNLSTVYKTRPLINVYEAVKNGNYVLINSSKNTATFNEETGKYKRNESAIKEEIDSSIKEMGTQPFDINDIRDVYLFKKTVGDGRIPKGTIVSKKDMDRGYMFLGSGDKGDKIPLKGNVERKVYAIGTIKKELGKRDNFELGMPYEDYKKIYGSKTMTKAEQKSHDAIIKKFEDGGYNTTGGLDDYDYYIKSTSPDNLGGNTQQTEYKFKDVPLLKVQLKNNTQITADTKSEFDAKLKSMNINLDDYTEEEYLASLIDFANSKIK